MKKISIFSIIFLLGVIGYIGYITNYIVLVIGSPLIFFIVMEDLVLKTFKRNLKCFIVREAVRICTDIVHASFAFIASMYLVLMGTFPYSINWVTLSIALLVTIYTCVYVFSIGSRIRAVVKKDHELYEAGLKLIIPKDLK